MRHYRLPGPRGTDFHRRIVANRDDRTGGVAGAEKQDVENAAGHSKFLATGIFALLLKKNARARINE
jgi:hypothetical protein